ncbi:MAG: GAF domain-containing sensor histidine kinase [Firmicutes bacterium]|nr:GAF domain-containing sensor histidine kinase [Bacillota bacterium]
MFSDELARSGTLFCTRLSRWYGANRTSIPGGRCRKCQEFGYETVVAVPVKTAGKILGLIHLYDPREKALSADDLLFLETVSSPLGYALKHLQDRETIRESEEKLKSSYEKLRVFSSMVLKVQEEEKKRLSRELHDEIGQALTAVKIDLQVIKKELGKRDQGFQERLTDSIGLVDSTLEQVRKQVVSLRPPGLDHMGLVAAVQNMVRGFSRRTGIKARIIAGDKIGRFSSEVETALFRCIQESLTNIARHAGAKEVIIEFKYSPEYLSVSIKDDGKGFEPAIIPATPSSFGLAGMRERVELLNGKFKVDSEPKQGTRITVAIPLPRKGGG